MQGFFAPRRQAGRLALAIGFGALLASSTTGWAAKPPVSGDPTETFGVQGPTLHKAQKAVRPTPRRRWASASATCRRYACRRWTGTRSCARTRSASVERG